MIVDKITALYAVYFNRLPDKAGLEYWIDQAQKGMSFDEISKAFLASPEYQLLEAKVQKYNLMFYISGDNNLNDNSQIYNSMLEKVALSKNMQIEILRDSPTGATLEKITSNGVVSKTSVGSINAGDSATLTNFINNSTSNNPEAKNILSIFGHGAGINGLAFDDGTAGSDGLTIKELSSAIKQSEVHFDVVNLQACKMGLLDVYDSLKSSADVVVASQLNATTSYIFGVNWLDKIVSGESKTAEDIGTEIVVNYQLLSNWGYFDKSSTMAAVSSRGLVNVESTFNKLAHDLVATTSRDFVISALHESTGSNINSSYHDLIQFSKVIFENQDTTATIKSDAKAVIDATEIAVITYLGDGGIGTGAAGYHGINFIAPEYQSVYQENFSLPTGNSGIAELINFIA